MYVVIAGAKWLTPKIGWSIGANKKGVTCIFWLENIYCQNIAVMLPETSKLSKREAISGFSGEQARNWR